MRRIASHYTYYHQIYRMHYAELDNQGALTGVSPLGGEIAGTEFYDGILIPVACSGDIKSIDKITIQWIAGRSRSEILSAVLEQKGFSLEVKTGEPVQLLLLTGISLPPAELCTDNSCCNGYIKRL